MNPWRLNTSNPGKRAEYARFFQENVTFTNIDLPEIDADPISVVVHKASSIGEGILVDDTSLDIDGAAVGIHVKWLKDKLPEYIGKKAKMRVLLAFREGDQVHIYEGVMPGKISAPVAKGKEGFGFDPVFIPQGATKTFAEEKPDALHPRALAVKNLLLGKRFTTMPAIDNWQGKMQ